MRPFCEIIVADVLPMLRAVVADELSKEYGLSQIQISKKLGVTQPAISQYKKELRGQGAKMILANDKVMKLIKDMSHEIAINDADSIKIHKSLCEICSKIRKEGLICGMHRGKDCDDVLCNLCR